MRLELAVASDCRTRRLLQGLRADEAEKSEVLLVDERHEPFFASSASRRSLIGSRSDTHVDSAVVGRKV